ncbi:MAG: hypothetical protein ACFFD6_07885, partial [Candidatus Thorarchaeota archaeon]
MIKLIGVLSEGGIPVYMKGTAETEGEMILGPLVEASRSLSSMMGSGDVRKLAFRENTMVVTESKKGYTIVALVSRAEDYMDSLLRVISDALDMSDLAPADGSVMSEHKEITKRIVDLYIKEDIEASFPEVVSSIWSPISDAVMRSPELSHVREKIDRLFEKKDDSRQWAAFKEGIHSSLGAALSYALRGAFDYACAASFDEKDVVAKIFTVKMGALTMSMTKARSPPVSELKRIANEIPDNHQLAKLVKTLVGYISNEIIPADYSRAFREAVQTFQLHDDDDENLMLGFMFLDTRIVDYPVFAERMVSIYSDKSEVVRSYIQAIEERTSIFDKLYSITSYDDFRDEMGVHKGRISSIISSIDKVLVPEIEGELMEGRGLEIGIAASLKLQNYITLLTALSESPILTIGERGEMLEEVLSLYRDYFRTLMQTRVPLFAFTIDSVFQSLSVAYAEYYFILTGQARDDHLHEIITFLSDIMDTMEEEWPKTRVRFSLFVVANAIFPVLTRAGILHENEIRIIWTAMMLQDVKTIDAIQITRPQDYATNLGNTVTSLTALASKLLPDDTRKDIMKLCVATGLDVQTWFMSNGVICRDDIISTTFHASQALEFLGDSELEPVVNQVVALNRVAIQDFERYDYEVPMIASTLIEVLVKAWKKLGDERYHDLAKELYDVSFAAWR